MGSSAAKITTTNRLGLALRLEFRMSKDESSGDVDPGYDVRRPLDFEHLFIPQASLMRADLFSTVTDSLDVNMMAM